MRFKAAPLQLNPAPTKPAWLLDSDSWILCLLELLPSPHDGLPLRLNSPAVIALREDFDNEFEGSIRETFGRTGVLSQQPKFEYRPEQQQMAESIARALRENRHLVVEAGTGVGKSLAYLVPSLLFGLENRRKVIVSTHTINLQEQLLHQDIPAARRVDRKSVV